MKTRTKLIIIGIALTFTSLSSSQSFSETQHTTEITKFLCGGLALDGMPISLEEQEWVKTTLEKCVERELITQKNIEMIRNSGGHLTREIYALFRVTNGDIDKISQLVSHPNYPINVFGSPYKQVSIGIEPENVLCKDGLELIFKSKDNSPTCVKSESISKLIERGWTAKNDSTLSKINKRCMTLDQSKETAPFFKIPTYLPEGYSYVCSRSGMPFESYIVYYNQEFPTNWQIPELVSDGAIFIYQIDERNLVGEKEFQTYGSPEQHTRETYDEVMKNNPSLSPQLITINGMLAYAVDSCPDCGTQTANFTDGTMIQKSTSSETRIKFIDENGVSYMLETTLPLQELIKVAESLE